MMLTIPEMAAVDTTIETHGGWPAAFAAPSGLKGRQLSD
jgi:hypothetical protein